MNYRLLAPLLALPCLIHAASLTVDMYAVNPQGVGQPIGQVTIEDSHFGGVLITPQLSGLPAGAHGFHLHQMPDCNHAKKEGHFISAGAAQGHYDPEQTNSHAGPYGMGHLGDLPVLVVNKDGTATTPTLAPRLKASDFQGHALMIHAGGDNYSDTPLPLGGGGDRVACGTIVKG